jgi:hypothetical protein
MSAKKTTPPPLPSAKSGKAAVKPATAKSTPAKSAAAKAAPAKLAALKPAFPKKNLPPTPAAFAAHLPLSLGKRLDLVRAFLVKQKGVREDVYFYGPESGWALRYLQDSRPLCSLHVHDARPVGIVSLEAPAAERVDWKALSPAGRKARQQAHGSPSLLWLDVPLEGGGAADFRTILRAKIEAAATPGENRENDAQEDAEA